MPHDEHTKRSGKHTPTSTVSKTNGKHPSRKLVLHFDIRNTLIMADSVTKITVEQAINAYLARVVWGRVTKSNKWEWACSKPSTQRPVEDSITYYKYLEKKIVRDPVDRVTTLRHAVGDLAQTPEGKRFEGYHKKAIDSLRWTIPAEPKLTVKGRNGKNYHYILPAFYQLLDHLSATQRDFSIIIRTFGLHCEEVLDSIEHSCSGKHPMFPNLPSMPLNRSPGKISRTKDSISLTVPPRETAEDKPITSEREIYNYLNSCVGVSGIVDDFHHWQDNDFYFKCSKPHWIDLTDKDTHHIMIDDNYRPDDSDSIINARVFDSKDGEVKSLSKDEAKRFDDVCMVTMDLLKCAEDEMYFVQMVNDCEQRYQTILDDHSS